MSVDDAGLIWAAYATAIASLTGVASLNLTSTSRFAIAMPNQFSLPSILTTSQLFQNYELRNIAGMVPTSDVVLTPSSIFYDQAYRSYLNNAAINTTHDPFVQGEISTIKTEIESLNKEAQDMSKKAWNAYQEDTVQGVYKYSGLPMTLPDYEALWYPQINDDLQQAAGLQNLVSQLEFTDNALGTGQQLAQFRNAIALACNESTFHQGYNMPVMVTDEAVTVKVANGIITANDFPVAYLPAYSIAGSFNSVSKRWSDTFPASYPDDMTAYLKGSSRYYSQNINTSTNALSELGYSTTKSATSHNWLIVSWDDSSTSERITKNINITSKQFGSGINVTAWGIDTFDVGKGIWFEGNPIPTFPILDSHAPNGTLSNIQHHIIKLVLGYGIEVNFVLKDEVWDYFYSSITTARTRGGSANVLGILYDDDNKSEDRNTRVPWDQLVTNNKTRGVTLRARHNKVPQLLGAVIGTIS